VDFREQVVVVTGGSGGIGAATVRMLAARGARVLASYHTHAESLEALCADCAELPGEVVAQYADVRERASVDGLVEAALARWGQIDALITCAGMMEYTPIEMIDQASWQAALQINLDGVYYTCKAVLRPMMRRRSGRIVNISALHGLAGGPLQAAYSAATGAVLGLTRALAREAAPWSISVNAVAPGLVATPMIDVIPEQQRVWGEQVIALPRVGRPEQVPAAAMFLSTPQAT
jgi:3-oxoacyl-[acyl-carrier protein] reductase